MFDTLAMLDEELLEVGEDIKIQRITGGVTVAAEVTVRAKVGGFALEMIGINGITEQTSKVIASPSKIIAAGWTSGRPAYEDQRVPMRGNRVIVAGRVRQVEAGVGVYVNGELVRIEMRVL